MPSRVCWKASRPVSRCAGLRMSTILAFIISLGLIGAGVGWIVAGPNSALCIGIGIASIVVGALSVLNELRHRSGWR